ncbi:MAG: hypothetical protein IKW88_00965 [Clostridiales bacterium]|nr:hypothetical protein [Clostridiales bacterium]
MKVKDLTRDQLIQLKQHYLTELRISEGTRVSFAEIAEADSLVSDEVIFKEYARITFTEDDFY